ncbi:MAG: EcsC family protein [Solirubrobacteraceae bacterium]|nr:EcsC family protein [Patulibacter sp.]
MPDFPELPQLPKGLIADLRADPTYALETLAMAAVDVHGPAAAKWKASRGQLRYSKEQFARSAIQRSVNSARVEGAAMGMGGFLTIVPDTAALAWILTREVIFVAAAYGFDPTDPRRAAEVLVVCEIYDSVPKAQDALDHRGERIVTAIAKTQVVSALKNRGRKERTLGNKLLRYSGKKLADKYGGRLVPGVGAVLGALDNAAAAKSTGERAIAFYRAQ